MSETKENVAFKDFKGSLTVQEFKTVFRICKERYEKLSQVLEQRKKFMDKALEQFDQTKEAIEGSPLPNDKAEKAIGGLKKLLKGLSKRGDNKMRKEMKTDILEIMYLTEFLNRFSADSGTYEELDFSFLTENKEDE